MLVKIWNDPNGELEDYVDPSSIQHVGDEPLPHGPRCRVVFKDGGWLFVDLSAREVAEAINAALRPAEVRPSPLVGEDPV